MRLLFLTGRPLSKALEPGERWVTAHPNGEGTKGVPLLIQEHTDGTSSVVGGAGGKLNHLRLHGVRSKSDYKADIAGRSADAREQRKQQVARDKELGLHDAKAERLSELTAKVGQHRESFVSAVSKLAGWDDASTRFDHEAHAGLSPDALALAQKQHKGELYKRAVKTVELNRQRLVMDADARLHAGLGELPLESANPQELSVADLDPAKQPAGLGFDPHYRDRAGSTVKEIKAEAGTQAGRTPEQMEASAEVAAALSEKAEAIKQECEAFAAANPDTPPLPTPKVINDVKSAADLCRALKALRMVEKQAKDAKRELASADTVEAKAAVLEVSPADVEAAVAKEVEGDVRTMSARAFLAGVRTVGGDEEVAPHVATGAYNSLNGASLALAGAGMIDRSVVDVLGIAGAAAVLHHRLAASLSTEDLEKAKGAMEDHHVASSKDLEGGALAKAKELHDAAAAIELPEAGTGLELLQAQELNEKRRAAINESRRVIGTAHGALQASAAMVAEMQGAPRASLDVPMGKVGFESAISQLRAIGLKKGDYKLDNVAGNTVATVTADGMRRISGDVDVDGMKQVRRNLDILEGKQDEDGWLPGGFADRPDLSMHVEPGVAQRCSLPFDPAQHGGDLNAALQAYVGGRMADGDAPVDILADAQSSDFFQKAGDEDAYRAALDAVMPLKGEDGKMRPVDSLRPAFEKMADEFVQKQYGAARKPIHQQQFSVDQKSVDALHRALTATPEGVAAWKTVGDLTAKERNGLRNWWAANIAKEDPKAGELRASLESHEAAEPEKSSTDMFGEEAPNPEWGDWKSKRDNLAGQVSGASLDWQKYVKTMGSPEAAITAVQDLVRSRVVKGFADTHNTLNAGSPLKLGKAAIRGGLDHLDAVDPEARSARVARERELTDSLRERSGGKYSAGSVKDKLADAAQQKQAFEQSQLGMFSTEELPEAQDRPLGGDERYTVGHAAEQQLAGMMSVVGQNFRAGKPTRLWQPSMSGGKNAPRQRLIKLLAANKRVVAAFGTGSGKSALQLGGFTHLHELGKVKKGIIIAPSIVVGQFGGEALRYLKPGQFKWHAEPGASRDERLAAYRDPETHFSVVTHQSFRDDMIHLGATHAGIPESEMAAKLQSMTDDQRAAWSHSIMEKEGFKFDYMTTDESQYTLNREGKENSRLANVVDSFAEHADYYMPSSGDPVKNDASEIFDVLRKMDRKRYGDRDAFMRKYGADTVGSRDALRREMARYMYPSKIDPDVKADRKVVNVELNAGQKTKLADVDRLAARARLAHMRGDVDMDAMKALAPDSFSAVPEDQHKALAAKLQKTAGIMRNAAVQRIINRDPDGAKFDAIVSAANERKGKPGIVFAKNLDAVKSIHERLKAEGFRVVSISGADSAQEKDRKRLMFNPESGEAQADILVASDAAATGLNLQRGQWEWQHDTPDTAMIHGQRNGRIFRTGQKNDVELLDGVANHRSERKSRDRLAKKYALREMMTDPLEGLDDSGLAWNLRQRGYMASNDQQGSMF